MEGGEAAAGSTFASGWSSGDGGTGSGGGDWASGFDLRFPSAIAFRS